LKVYSFAGDFYFDGAQWAVFISTLSFSDSGWTNGKVIRLQGKGKQISFGWSIKENRFQNNKFFQDSRNEKIINELRRVIDTFLP
jgi:hypothetical protein